MKFITIDSLGEALYKVCDVKCSETFEVEVPKAEGTKESESVKEDETKKEEKETRTVTKLTAAGRNLNNILATIDKINGVDIEFSHRVVEEFNLEDYQIMTCLKPLIRPGRVVPVGETMGIVFSDLLDSYESMASDEGEVLSPSQFLTAQTRLMRGLNRKYTELTNVCNVSRDVIVATEELYSTTPTKVDNYYAVIRRVSNPLLFPLKRAVADEVEYVTRFNDSLQRDYIEDIARDIVRESSARPSVTSNKEG